MFYSEYIHGARHDMSFPTTRWSLIVASTDAVDARAAWGALAERYRAPVLAWFRCRYGVDQAEDLTQRFFADSIAGGWWARADAARGSFRTFLRVLLQRYGARHVERGFGVDVEVDALQSAERGPAEAYDRAFAHALAAGAFARLEQESVGRPELAPLLPLVLDRGEGGELKALAERSGVAHNTMVQRLRRLRLRYRELLRAELAELLADPRDIDRELAELRHAFQ